MARNYAQFATSIWRPGDDFGELNMAAQWAYFMLTTQSDISAAGVLSLSVKRWAGRAQDTTRDSVVVALRELDTHRFVVYDTDTEELLVRTFVKWDGGYGNRKRRPVILRAAEEIESLALRRVLAKEFARLDLPVDVLNLPAESEADSPSARYIVGHNGEPENGANGSVPPTPEDAFPQVDRASDATYRFDGVAEVPQPSTLNPHPVPPSAATTVALVSEPLFAAMPETPKAEPSASGRAFGLARHWIEVRKAAKTPVIARGKNGALHVLRNLIEPFAEGGYTDDEIKQALVQLDEGAPSKAQMDRTLSRLRTTPTGYQGRQVGYPSGHNGSNAIAVRDYQPRPSTGTQRMQQALDVAAQLDEQFATEGNNK